MKGFCRGKKNAVELGGWRMNGFCRGKENNVGLSRWKNERALQREGEQCWVKQMEE